MATNSPTYSDEPKKDVEGEEEEYQEYSSEHDLSEEEQTKLVDKLDKMFQYALMHPSWIEGRKKMIQCFQYAEGEQWTSAERDVLDERGQPDTTNNQISVVVNKLMGDLVNQRMRVGYRGRNGEDDQAVASAIADAFRYVHQTNDLEFEERDMARDGFTCGMGVLDVEVTFDDMLQPDLKVRHEDPLIVFPDPDGRRYDWNEDGNFVCSAPWWKLTEAIEVYPHAELGLKGVMGSATTGDSASGQQLSGVDAFKGENYVDKENERVRVIKVQYKKCYREQLLIFGDGTSKKVEEKKEINRLRREADAKGIQHRLISRVNHQICVGIYAAGVLLEHKETDNKTFSLVPYWAYRRKNGEPYSLVTLSLSMQDAINKRESKALHLLNTNQAIYERNAVPNPKAMAEERAKPDGNIEVADGALTNQKFIIKDNIELAATQFQMHKTAQEDLFKILGMDPKMGQQTGELRSGVGVQRKFMEASKPIATLFDNIRRTRKILGRVVLDRIQNYFTPDKIMLITDDQGASQKVGLTVNVMQKLKTGLYDVIVEELEDNATVQQEQTNQIMQLLPQILPFGMFWTKLVIEMSDMRNKKEIIAALDKQNGPPPIQPKMNLQANLDALDVEERAGVWELVGRADIAQKLRANPPMPASELKIAGELAKEERKSGSQGEKEKAAAQREKTALEMEQSKAEHGMKMQEMTVKHEIDMKKAAMQVLTAQNKQQKEAAQ